MSIKGHFHNELLLRDVPAIMLVGTVHVIMLCVTAHMRTETDSMIFGLAESSLFGLDTLTGTIVIDQGFNEKMKRNFLFSENLIQLFSRNQLLAINHCSFV